MHDSVIMIYPNLCIRAYVVHARPDAIRDELSRGTFCREIENWIQSQVARHKYLRGGAYRSSFLSVFKLFSGVVVIDVVPKRY